MMTNFLETTPKQSNKPQVLKRETSSSCTDAAEAAALLSQLHLLDSHTTEQKPK